jgi:hypothetical protein
MSIVTLSCVVVLTSTTGCKRSEPGGAGKETFTIGAPPRSTSVTAGERENVTLTIRPSRQFKQTVKLQAKPMQDGIKPSFEEQEVAIDGGNRDIKLTVAAGDSAAAGKYGIRVTATPEKGDPTSIDLDVNVERKSEDKFDLTGPLTATNVMQGESNTISLTLRPSRDFKQTVKLEAKPLEDGIKSELQDQSVKLNGENREIKLTVSADKNAAAGKRQLRVTATPESGGPKYLDVSINVKKK